jgi:hypothetical protein
MWLKSVGFVDRVKQWWDSCHFQGFCPISLVSGIIKIIANILANKLKVVLEKIISKSLNAFILDR